MYRDCFETVYLYSPSIHVDHTWNPVNKYLDEKMILSEDEPLLHYDHYDAGSLEQTKKKRWLVTRKQQIIINYILS